MRSTFQQWKNSCATVSSRRSRSLRDRARRRSSPCCCGAPCRRRSRTAGSRRGTCRSPARTRGTRRRSRLPAGRSSRRPSRSRRARRRCRCGGRRTGTCARPTVNWRMATGPNSDGLSIRYWQVRRRELERRWRAPDVQLRRDLPARAGRLLERDGDRPLVEAVRPHDGRRHVDVRVRRVDAEVRAVHAVAVHLVLHRHAAAVTAHVPPVRIRPRRRQLASVGAERRARRRRSWRSRASSSAPATIGSSAARACRRRRRGTTPPPASSGAAARGR